MFKQKRLMLILILFILIIVISGCGGNGSSNGAGYKVSGQITRQDNGLAIEGVTLIFSNG